ncbi:Matrilin-4 [Podospora aff. communis PSN243]|uniref:Matrilin-4 n=1 Tax=Podospora aff. communis PSN243 TaxID=3040156 RepID=A0AAV9G904_9PEZI|nr:Matrilin-4 [Podospora aff. communis PSN243]
MAIPVASFGSKVEFADAISDGLLPEFDVVHVVLNIEAALSELPAIASGNLDTPPASGLGSNTSADAAARKVPRAIIFAGNLPEDDIKSVQDAVSAVAPDVKFILITKEDILGAGVAGPPNPVVIAQILKDKLTAAAL